METLITRDTDVLREYLSALDASERGISPFAKLAAIVKLTRLRRELRAASQLETTDQDIARLCREVDDRLERTLVRRCLSTSWGARLAVFLMQVVGQQLALLLVLLATMLFVSFVPPVANWNPVYPNDQPGFLFVFIFLFFFMTPMLALATLFAGRYFSSWRVTVPATLILAVLSVLGVTLVIRANPIKQNPVTLSSLGTFARDPDRGLNPKSYREWVGMNWLINDPKFQRDYESYLRKGPGRWITSGLKDDAAWVDSLKTMREYLDGGQDPGAFREWLTDYLSRNRIYSEDRIPQEVSAITGEANQRFLGVWQVEPYLRERDVRVYRAYLGSINSSMKRWALLGLGLYTVAFLIYYLIGSGLSVLDQAFGGRSRTRAGRGDPFGVEAGDPRDVPPPGLTSKLRQRYYSFPERSHITTPPFFDGPFRMLSRIHRSYVGFAVSASIFVFAFWAVVYYVDLASGHENASSQVALMRSQLLFAGPPDGASYEGAAQARVDGDQRNLSYANAPVPYGVAAASRMAQSTAGSEKSKDVLTARVLELEDRLEDEDYVSGKRFKEQARIIAGQRSEIDSLKRLSSQLRDTTSGLPTQVAELTTRATAAEARAGEGLGEAGTAKQRADTLEKQLTAKIGEVETRTTRASDQIGKVEDRTSVLQTRTESLEKEFDRRTGQVEARTEELGERTAGLKEREERVDRLQQIAFAAIVSNISSDVDSLDRRLESAFYRLFSKGEAQRDVDSLRRRITQLAGELRAANTDQAKVLIGQLEELSKRIDQVATRIVK
jgi:predicted  nucleic acid-binding Zn-ribbon protein